MRYPTASLGNADISDLAERAQEIVDGLTKERDELKGELDSAKERISELEGELEEIKKERDDAN
jgi:predicted  nucleic acid-binding Zn-ribbon protein